MTARHRVRSLIREPLGRTLRWLLGLRDAQGRILCPEHRIEHTGKSAGAAVLAAELAGFEGEPRDELLAVARQQGARMVSQLVREGNSPCHTFRPGWHDPFNCSNSIIDGGACSDALAQIVQTFGPELEALEREQLIRASVLHARTYLRYAVLDKGIPAQRAWGLTGLAQAAALARGGQGSAGDESDLTRSALEAIGALDGIQNSDGSYPYQPLDWQAAPVESSRPAVLGASDVSAFYHSRIGAFVFFALEALGRDPSQEPFADSLRRGLEFLHALAGPDGIKCGLIEAKPWYWGGTYEVASHPFDVFALVRGWRHFGVRAHADAAWRAFRTWVDHLSPDGRPSSHHGENGRSFQCPLFWAAHAMWIARAARDLEAAGEVSPPASRESLDLSVRIFPDASLARIEDGVVCAWVRGLRPGYSADHGSPHGAGLLRVVRKSDGSELVHRVPHSARPHAAFQEGEWTARVGSFSAPRGWRGAGRELGFSIWLARVHLRGGRRRDALLTPWHKLRRGFLAFSSPMASSAFCTRGVLEPLSAGVLVRGSLAHRGGDPLPDSRLERRYEVDGAGLLVADRLLSGPGAEYSLPAAATEVYRGEKEFRYRLA